jgi:hypothetical protein
VLSVFPIGQMVGRINQKGASKKGPKRGRIFKNSFVAFTFLL